MNKKLIGDMLRQAQDLQERMAKAHEEASQKVVEASSGGNMVTVRMNGKQELLSLVIDPEIAKSGDLEMLQDLIVAAVNEGVRKSQESVAEEIKGLGMNIPGFPKGLF